MKHSEDEEARIKELWNKEGCSAGWIAKEFGTTRNAMIGYINRHRQRLKLERRAEQRPRKMVLKKTRRPFRVITKPEKPAVLQKPVNNWTPPPPEPGFETRQCRWPTGHPKEPDFRFCDQTRTGDTPYCLEHYKQAYQAHTWRKAIVGKEGTL